MGWFTRAERSEAQIEAEIADELEFHLEQRTRELVDAGMGAEEARAEAERRFGSVERVRKDCRWVQLGERIMLQRIQVALNVVLVVALGVLGLGYWQSNRVMREQLQRLSALLEPRAAALAPQATPAPNPILERFQALKDAPAAVALANELMAYSPQGALDALCDGWQSVRDPKLRIALLDPFMTGGGNASAIEILDLGATDPDAAVREAAFRHLKSYAWQDFSGKPISLYQEWYSRVRRNGVVNALSVSVQAYGSRLGLLRGADLLRELQLLDEIDLAPGSLRGFDSLDTLWRAGPACGRECAKHLLASDDPELQLAGLRFAAHFRIEEDIASLDVLGALATKPWRSTAHAIAACRALAACDQLPLEWYSECTLRLLRLCVEDGSPEVRRDVGKGLLARLWQLPSGTERGAAQWLAWWKENRGQFRADKLLESEDARWLDAR